MDRGVHIVVEVTQVFKDGRLGVRLGELIADVLKGNALGKGVFRQAAHAVRVHGLIGDGGLRRMGLAVALVLAYHRVNFFSLGAGQLCFF